MTPKISSDVVIGDFWQHYRLRHTVEIIRVWEDAVEFSYKGYSQVYLMEDFLTEFDKVSVEPMQ